jgi:hypothetical protein
MVKGFCLVLIKVRVLKLQHSLLHILNSWFWQEQNDITILFSLPGQRDHALALIVSECADLCSRWVVVYNRSFVLALELFFYQVHQPVEGVPVIVDVHPGDLSLFLFEAVKLHPFGVAVPEVDQEREL